MARPRPSMMIAVNAVLLAATRGHADPIDRPLTLSEHTFAATTDLYASHRSVSVGGITASSTSEAARVGLAFGLTDRLELDLELAFSLHHFQTDQPLALAASLALVHTDKLDVGVTAGFVVARDPTDPKSRLTARVELGVGARYRLRSDLALYAGGAGIQSGRAVVGTALGPLAPTALGQELVIGVRAPSSLELPVGILVEATPRLELGFGTILGHLAIANDTSRLTIPVELAARVAVHRALDLTAFIDVPDLRTTQLDLVFFGLGVRYYH